MIPGLRKLLLLVAAVSMALTVAMPDTPVSLAARAVTGLLATWAVAVGVRAHYPTRSLRSHLAHPDPWVLLGAGTTLRCLGDVAGTLGSGESAALAVSISGMALVFLTAAGLVQMLKQRFSDRFMDHVLEGVIVAGTISLMVWVGLFEPLLRQHHTAVSNGVSSAVAITIALVLAAFSLHLYSSFENRQSAFFNLSISQILPAIGGVMMFVGEFPDSAYFSRLGSSLLGPSYAFLAIGALHSSMSLYQEPSGPAGARLGRWRLFSLVAPVVIGPLILTLCLTHILTLSPLAVSSFTLSLSLLVVGHLIAMVQARASSTHWASHDKLTGLPNRALFRERTASALDRTRKLGNSVSVLYLDLDRFKHINDSMGHEAGDQLLEQVARRILSCVDAGDTVARLGGDEFAILVPAVDDDRIPRQLARRLLKTFQAPFNLRPRPVFMSPSIGVALSEGNVSLETLLTQADTSMYRAKESGRNNFAVWSQEMNEASKQRLLLETHLHSAIANDELRLVYQPKVELATGRVVGVEALIRWHHPKLGVISPSVFIHLAEESGLINQIGEWVLETACKQARIWYDSGFSNLTVAVNLSSRQFQQQHVADLVSRVLRQTRLAPHLLELELTESLAMSGDDATIATLTDLRAMGVKCAIDDFGTGYSNLSYLSRFPIDTLKIDKSFIEQIDNSGGDAGIVVAIIAMAHGLGLHVVAEGVETPEQAAFLADHDCDEMQGFLFSRPLPASELEGLLMLEHVASGPGRLTVPIDKARRALGPNGRKPAARFENLVTAVHQQPAHQQPVHHQLAPISEVPVAKATGTGGTGGGGENTGSQPWT